MNGAEPDGAAADTPAATISGGATAFGAGVLLSRVFVQQSATSRWSWFANWCSPAAICRRKCEMPCPPRMLLAALTLPFLLPALLRADDWPQWRGPNRDGVWGENGILETFPAG